MSNKYALNLNQDGRILAATFAKFAPNGVLVNSLPEGNISDYLYVDGEYVHDPIIPVVSVEEQITQLKEELSSTDYKIIKCSEASLVGEEMPYDIQALHAERQVLRDKINELEGGVE